MWTRDSAVQMGLYNGRLYTTVKASPAPVSSSSSTSSSSIKTTTTHPPAHETTRTTPTPIRSRTYLRRILEGAIRRQAFNLLQDPYANAYSSHWHHPNETTVWHDKDRVIGRGGWVETRNYELDSGAYFLTQVYDYYLIREQETTTTTTTTTSRHTDQEEEADLYYRSHQFFATSSSSYTLIYDAIMVLIETWIIEQYHDTQSNYRYFELPNQGKGKATTYTGMTWTGFRPR